MRVTGHDIIERVAQDHCLPVVALTGQRRTKQVAIPRQTAMYLMRDLCPHLSLPAIGRLLGGRDHTTVLHGVRVTAKRIAEDPILADYIRRVVLEMRPREDLLLRVRIIEQRRHLKALYEMARAA